MNESIAKLSYFCKKITYKNTSLSEKILWQETYHENLQKNNQIWLNLYNVKIVKFNKKLNIKLFNKLFFNLKLINKNKNKNIIIINLNLI